MAPELKLIFAVGGSAFMFHLTNSLFKNTLPGISSNPQMMNSVRRMATGAMSGMMGGGGGGGGGIGGALGGMFGRGGGPVASNAPMQQRRPMPQTPARPPMKGPSGSVDDILNDLINRDPKDIDHGVAQDIDAILNNESRFSDADDN